MKWKPLDRKGNLCTEIDIEVQCYNNSVTRTITKFLFFPKEIAGETRWLRSVAYQQSYGRHGYGNYYWTDVEWID